MGRIYIGGTWKDIARKIRIGGIWKDACFKYRINGIWSDDGCTVKLVLPPRAIGDRATISMRTFIDSWISVNGGGKDYSKKKFIVFNYSNQPKIISGDLSVYKQVEFRNMDIPNPDGSANSQYGDVQGNANGSDGLVLSSQMKLLNLGTIRGAGGKGGDGGGGPATGITLCRVWESRGSYDDGGPYVQGQMSPLWDSPDVGGIDAYYNRFWKPGGGANSGAWVLSGSPGGQEYWDTALHDANNAPIWGDQGYCHYNTSGYWCKEGLYIAERSQIHVIGGSAGIGGDGAQFENLASEPGTLGGTSTTTGPANPFDDNGFNIDYSAGTVISGNGGHGGAWATKGTDGTDASDGTLGQDGQVGGAAIRGASFLIDTPDTGNTIGDVIQ